jgi:hypothetical protein
MKAAGLMDCKNYKAKQTAILRYEGAPTISPTTTATWESMVGDNKKIVVGFSLRFLLLLQRLAFLIIYFQSLSYIRTPVQKAPSALQFRWVFPLTSVGCQVCECCLAENIARYFTFKKAIVYGSVLLLDQDR